MALNVLIAAPKTDFLLSASQFLKQSNFNVEHASNGKDAQVLFPKQPYFAVILHIDLQNFSALQVLKFIKSQRSAEKLIIIGCSEEKMQEMGLDNDALMKLGATEILEHDPSPSDLKMVLEGHQSITDIVSNLPKKDGVSEEEAVEGEDSKYTAIEIDSLVPGKNMIFDVFIRLGQNKYLKILHAGDTFQQERITKYKEEKKITHLYINSNDRGKMIQWNNFVLEKVSTSDKVSADKKVNLLKNTSEKLIEGLYVDGLKPQMVDQAKTLCQNTFKTLEKEKSLYKLLRTFQDMDPNAYSHSFTVSLFAGMICKQFEWNSQTIFETFTMASLMHDIGKVKLPKEIALKKQNELSVEEMAIYRTHPQLSVEILENSSLITQPVKQIILQHHEASDGTGFPFGLKDSNILTSSKILIFVNDFVDYITANKISPVEGVRFVLGNKELTRKYNGLVLENFTKIFIDPDKVQRNIALPSNSTLVPTRKN